MATQDISQLVVDVKSQGIQTAANQLDKLATSADKAEAAVKKLGTAVVGSNATLSGGVAQTAALVAVMTSLTVVLDRLSQSQARATVSTRANNEAMAEAHALARGLSGSLGALWVTYGNFAGMGLGIAIGASLKGIVGVGKDVEQTLESIRVLGGATMAEVGQMANTINDLGKGSQGPRDVAEALNVLTLAGLNAKQAMDGVRAALNLSVAGGVSVEKSAETLVQVGTALGYTADAYDHVADVIAKTAAASMSSVDSISNAFKSAAAVGEVYGASLQDIALGLAAVANLGIQGTSAGTALKNFYKDLSASTQKVTQTLKDMHLSIADFRDSQGFMLPLLDVVKKLDGGFNSLNQQQKKLAEVRMFSQQAVREFAVLSSMLHTAADDTQKFGSKLEEVAYQIQNAAAFSTLAAIAMSQTTANQLKSVGNTIETVFASVFADIQPQIGSVARSLKAAFNSDEFKSSLSSLATGIANVTKFLVEHAGALKSVAELYVGIKIVEFAAGLGKVALAFDVATVATRSFWVSLGPIGIAIAGLTALWIAYKESKDRALDNKPAEDNLQEYADRVKEAAQKELAVLEMKKKGYSDAAIAREQQYKADEEASQKAVNRALAGVEAMRVAKEAMWKGMSEQERRTANLMKANPGTREQTLAGGGSKFADYVKQELLYNEAVAKTNKLVKDATLYQETLRRARVQSADLDDKKAKENRFISDGDGKLTGKADVKGANDAYEAAIAKFQNDIKDANKELSNFREQEDAKFKAGQIGKLQLIDEVADKEIATYKRVAEDAEAQKRLAEKTPNKKADAERFQGVIDRANEDAEQADRMRTANRLTAEREAQAALTSLRVKSLEEEGKYVDAAALKWGSEGKIILDQITAEATRSGGVWEKLKAQYTTMQTNTMNSAQLKQDALAFDTALLQVQETLKGIKTATFGTGIDTMMDTATKATEKFGVAMVNAKAKRDKLLADANATKTPEAIKKYEEANKELLAVGDKQKTMWVEIGQTITTALTDAFGKGGQALGKLNEAMIQYQNSENASTEDRMKQYGDMSQAASGFFDKQSKGYRVLSTVSQAFHVAEMARTLIRTAASIAGGAAKMFEQLGIGAPAGIAMMAATMAGLGYAMSGGGGADSTLNADYVQKHQGTGTVLGDDTAKSSSIAKSLDEIKNNTDITLPLTQRMVSSLESMESSMKGLAALAIRAGAVDASNMGIQTGTLSGAGLAAKGIGTIGGGAVGYAAGAGLSAFTSLGAIGGPLGALAGAFLGSAISKFWGSTKQEITDSGLQFGGKVSDLESGTGFNQYAAVKTTKSSWFGLSKNSNTNVQTQGVDSALSRQFGQVFSGLSETLQSAATTLGTNSNAVADAIDNMVLNTTKVSLKDLKGQDLVDAINNVISGAMDEISQKVYPQVQEFQQVGEGYAQTVIRVATGIEQANAALHQLGVTAIDYSSIVNKQGDVGFELAKQSIKNAETVWNSVATSSTGVIGKILGNISGNASGTTLVGSLTGVGEIIDNMSGSVADLTAAYKSLVEIRKQMNLMGLNGDNLNIKMVTGAGSLSALQSGLNSYKDEYFTDQEKAAIMLKSVTAEFNKLGYALPASKAALRSLIEQTSNTDSEMTGKLLTLADTYSKALDQVDTATSKQVSTLNSTVESLQKFIDSLKDLKNSLALGDLSVLTPTEKYLEAKKQYEDTVAKAMAGDTTAQGNVSGMAQAYLEASRTINASSQAYTNTYNQVMKDIDTLGASGEAQLSNAEKQLAALQDQVTALNTLNATATNIASDLSKTTASSTPVTSTGTVAVDTKDLQAEIGDLKKQMAEQAAATAQQIANLTAALYHATSIAADKVSGAVSDTANTSAYVSQTVNNVTTTR